VPVVTLVLCDSTPRCVSCHIAAPLCHRVCSTVFYRVSEPYSGFADRRHPRCGAPPTSRSPHHTVDVPLLRGCCQPAFGAVVWGRSPTLREETSTSIQGPLRFPTVLCRCSVLSLRCNFVCVHAFPPAAAALLLLRYCRRAALACDDNAAAA